MLNQLRKGQSTAEYAIVIGLVVAAVMAMQVYIKRGIQGHIKDAVDYNDPAAGKDVYGTATDQLQYEPQYETTKTMKTTKDVVETETAIKDGGVERIITKEDVDKTAGGKQTILAP